MLFLTLAVLSFDFRTILHWSGHYDPDSGNSLTQIPEEWMEFGKSGWPSTVDTITNVTRRRR